MIRVPPRLLAPDRRRSLAAQAAVLTVGLVAALLTNPDRPLPFDVCAFKYLTGVPCPTCGLTRALCHALRGHWMLSLSYHPAGILAAAMLIGWTAWTIAEVARGVSFAETLRGRLVTALLTAGATISVVSWIVRLSFGQWANI